MAKFKTFVVVMREDLPAESTCTASTVESALELARSALPGGNMHRKGDKGKLVIYLPGTEVPTDVARHIDSGLPRPTHEPIVPHPTALDSAGSKAVHHGPTGLDRPVPKRKAKPSK